MSVDFVVLADHRRDHARFLRSQYRHNRMYLADLRGGCGRR